MEALKARKRKKNRTVKINTMPEHGVTKRLQNLMGTLLRNDDLLKIIEKEIGMSFAAF